MTVQTDRSSTAAEKRVQWPAAVTQYHVNYLLQLIELISQQLHYTQQT